MKDKKDDFIKILSSLTPEEINELVKRKCKPIKLIEPIKFD